MKLNLRIQYLAQIFALIFVIVIALSGIILFQFKSILLETTTNQSKLIEEKFKEDTKNQGKYLAKLFSEDIVNSLYFMNMTNLKHHTRTVKNFATVNFAYVFDAKGNLVHDGNPVIKNLGNRLAPETLKALSQKRDFIIEEQESMLVIHAPVQLEDQILGYVGLGLSLKKLPNEIQNLKRFAAQIGEEGGRKTFIAVGLTVLALIPIAVVLAFLLAKKMSLPIVTLQSILDNTSAVIYLKDTKGRYILINKAFENLLHMTNEEVRGKTDLDIFPKEIAEIHIKNDNNIIQSKAPMEMEETSLNKNETTTYLSIKFPIKDDNGEVIRVGGISTNITNRKQAEEKLKVFSNELKRSNKELEEFAYLASHDLQEPLRKIISFGDRLKDRLKDTDEKACDYLDRMQKASERMRQFIHDLLELSKVGRKPKPFITTDLAQLAHEVVVDLEKQIRTSKGTVNIGNLPSIEIDPAQMYQAFQNIISNAIKYSKKNVPPVIKISSHYSEESKNWNIIFEDNGIGFDEKYLNRIFKPFERLHGRNDYAGTGIGLAICKKISSHHNGSISAQSSLGQGSTFTITLPDYPSRKTSLTA